MVVVSTLPPACLRLVAESAEIGDLAASVAPAWVGWAVAAALAAAWAATAFVRRRSARKISQALMQMDGPLPAESGFPLLEVLGSDALRRMRHDRERHDLVEKRLREIERVLRATPIAVIALDHLQRVVGFNPAAERLLGFDGRAASGRLLQEVVRQPALNRAVERALASGGQLQDEIHLDFDTPVETQISCEPLQSESQPAGLVISLVDVTRMRRLESMRSEFAANVSLELRTPITNIKGYVETLLQVDVDDGERRRKFLEIIHRNTVRLSGIVEDILSLAFLEEPEARGTLVLAPTPVGDIVREVADALGSAAAARSIRIEVSVAEETVIEANRSLLEQALTNLVSNAVRYSGEQTTVRIAATRNGSSVRLSVEDEGPGIASKHLPRIFERFYRVDKARARSHGGTGLGLAIVKHIATIHGGTVEVTSQVGSGSCFTLILPVVQDAATGEQVGQHNIPSSSSAFLTKS